MKKIILSIALIISGCDHKNDYSKSSTTLEHKMISNFKETRTIKAVAIDLKEWFKLNHPDVFILLNDGASDQELKNFNVFFDNRLPSDFVEFYRYIDGQKDLDRPILQDGYVLLPISEVIETWKRTKAAMEMLDVEHRLSDDFGPIKGYIQNLNWIPFASNIAGDLYCVDLEPTKEGEYGQIIRVVKDDINLKLMARSFTDFIGTYEDMLKKKELVFNESYKAFINVDDIEDGKF